MRSTVSAVLFVPPPTRSLFLSATSTMAVTAVCWPKPRCVKSLIRWCHTCCLAASCRMTLSLRTTRRPLRGDPHLPRLSRRHRGRRVCHHTVWGRTGCQSCPPSTLQCSPAAHSSAQLDSLSPSSYCLLSLLFWCPRCCNNMQYTQQSCACTVIQVGGTARWVT